MDFYTADINVTNIIACVYVPSGKGQPVHKNRPSHGLVIQLEGKKKYVFDNGASFTASKGNVFYLPKYSNYLVKTEEEGSCIAVNFDISDSALTFQHFLFSPSFFSRYEENFQKLLNNWSLKNSANVNVCRMILYKIICDIQADMSKTYLSSKSKELASYAKKYIFQNISDCTLTVEKIAEHFDVSPEYFRKIFKSIYTVSPRRYIIEARMKKARELILSEEFTICDITHICGYDSETYFSTEFKRFYGTPPSIYKEAYSRG